MRIIEYNFERKYDENLELILPIKEERFKSGTELFNYLLSCFEREQFEITYWANSPNEIIIAKNNMLYKITRLIGLKYINKFQLDELLYRHALIEKRIFNIEINEEKEQSNLISFGDLNGKKEN